ncbi:hypothetical protein [Paenibacillus sp. FSL F4-0100]|uniref:hypothetical protein n=1 Tax=Paenibacillus sp. FSL F4-0100 TaxID=2921370 RepID=UPI0030EDA4FC
MECTSLGRSTLNFNKDWKFILGDPSGAELRHLPDDELYGVYVSGDKNIVPLKVANLAAFLFYRYKFLSRVEDKNLYRLP